MLRTFEKSFAPQRGSTGYSRGVRQRQASQIIFAPGLLAVNHRNRLQLASRRWWPQSQPRRSGETRRERPPTPVEVRAIGIGIRRTFADWSKPETSISRGPEQIGKTVLLAVLIAQIFTEIGLKLAVVGMEGCSKSRFGRTSLTEQLQNSLDVAHAIGVVDVRNRRQRLRVRQVSLGAGEAHETAFQHVKWNIMLGFKQLS